MIELKPLHPDHIDAALEKAERYRLLNEPRDAESICLDILAIDTENQNALIILLLAITDQFGQHVMDTKSALDILPRILGEYERHYYTGLVYERKAKAILERGSPGYRSRAYEAFMEAMSHFEKADPLSQADNDDAILRWNACARIINQEHLEASVETREQELLE